MGQYHYWTLEQSRNLRLSIWVSLCLSVSFSFVCLSLFICVFLYIYFFSLLVSLPSVSISRSFSVCLCSPICVFSDYFSLFVSLYRCFFYVFLWLSLLVVLSFSGSVFFSICVFLYFCACCCPKLFICPLCLAFYLYVSMFFSPRPIIAFSNWVKQIDKQKIEFMIKRITNDNRLWFLMQVSTFVVF